MCVWAIAIPLGSNSLHPHSSSFATGICFCSCFQLLFKLVGRGFEKGKGLWKRQGALEKARGFGKGQQQSHDKEAEAGS